MEKIFNKLVRDKIPDKIEKNGEYALTKTLNDNDFENALDNKLLEEVKEVITSRTPDEIKEELADLLEVMLKKAEVNNISFNDIEAARKQKKEVKGGFDTKTFLIKTVDQSYVDEKEAV